MRGGKLAGKAGRAGKKPRCFKSCGRSLLRFQLWRSGDAESLRFQRPTDAPQYLDWRQREKTADDGDQILVFDALRNLGMNVLSVPMNEPVGVTKGSSALFVPERKPILELDNLEE